MALASLKTPTISAEFRAAARGVGLFFHIEGRGRYQIGRPSEIGAPRGDNVIRIAPETTRSYGEIGQNAAHSAKRGLPRVEAMPRVSGMVSICGPGPGLVDTLDCVATDRKRGAAIWALKGTWRVLVARGIVPDAVVMMDAHPSQIAYTCGAPPMQWLLASMAHPDVFDALADEDVATWDAPEGRGISVGAHAIVLACQRGYADVRLYGYDCSWGAKRTHLYELANRQAAAAAMPIDVFHAGKRYTGTKEMCVEAREIMRLIDTPGAPRIVPCGTGLLPELFRERLGGGGWR